MRFSVNACIMGVALLVAAASADAPGRVTVPFDLGWRFTIAQPPQCDATSFNNVFLAQNCGTVNSCWPVDAGNEAECAAAACASNSAMYSWCSDVNNTHCSQRCVIGDSSRLSQVSPATANWTSFVRVPMPPPAAPQIAPTFNDSVWTVVDLPHDASVQLPHVQNSSAGEGFRLPVQAWYRKHFTLPSAWNTSAIIISVEAAIQAVGWWVNGVPVMPLYPSSSGYLPVHLRLDGVPNVTLAFGGSVNVLTVYTDNSARTGWWEEGAGLIRGGALVTAVASDAFIAPLGVAAPSYVSGDVHTRATPAEGQWADSVVVTPRVTVTLNVSQTARVLALWTLFDATGALVAAGNASATLGSGSATLQSGGITVAPAELWSVARPQLYTLSTALTVNGGARDAVNVSVGLRDLAWDADAGLRVNGAPIKMRGWCNHETFTGVGAALPPRVDLLRVQQLRGAGGNAWRASHNPPEPPLLDVCDRLGVLVLDENRVLATAINAGWCGDGGCRDVPAYAGNVVDDAALLALRDRNHASVAWYSVCNELGCGPGSLLDNDTALAVIQALDAADGSRAVTGNMGWQGPNATRPGTPISEAFDVMGMSHQSTATLDAFHAAAPAKPIAMTECCSCETQRGEDADLLPTRNASAAVYFSSEASACIAAQTSVSNAAPFCAGTFVWTLHDYGGEPGAWPHVSSSFGAIDFAGIPKPAIWFYRSWWLAAIPQSDPSRPPLNASVFVKLVESWMDAPNGTRNVHVYTNAPFARLSVNGAAIAPAMPVAPLTAATFYSVPFAPGSMTVQALGADGVTPLAQDAATSWGAPAALVLRVDAPSPRTGTGAAVFLDGADVALVRATVVDVNGVVCANASNFVTFSVSGGPALIVGAGSGDPADASIAVNARNAYHGLVRAIVRVALDASGDTGARLLRSEVNIDAGKGPLSSAVWTSPNPPAPMTVTVTASSAGLVDASVDIQLSVDDSDSVLAVAASSVGVADMSD